MKHLKKFNESKKEEEFKGFEADSLKDDSIITKNELEVLSNKDLEKIKDELESEDLKPALKPTIKKFEDFEISIEIEDETCGDEDECCSNCNCNPCECCDDECETDLTNVITPNVLGFEQYMESLTDEDMAMTIAKDILPKLEEIKKEKGIFTISMFDNYMEERKADMKLTDEVISCLVELGFDFDADDFEDDEDDRFPFGDDMDFNYSLN